MVQVFNKLRTFLFPKRPNPVIAKPGDVTRMMLAQKAERRKAIDASWKAGTLYPNQPLVQPPAFFTEDRDPMPLPLVESILDDIDNNPGTYFGGSNSGTSNSGETVSSKSDESDSRHMPTYTSSSGVTYSSTEYSNTAY